MFEFDAIIPMLIQLLFFAVSALVVFIGIALALILSQSPKPLSGRDTINFAATRRPKRDQLELKPFFTRDGGQQFYREIPAPDGIGPLVIVVHGSGWHGKGYVNFAYNLAANLSAHFVIPDLRGHGPNAKRRGDVDYIGQLEDDLADLILAKREQHQNVYLVGHSSGGGLVVRFCGGKHRKLVHGAVLLSPFLKYNAPTVRPKSGGWAHPLSRRIIGLLMLNRLGFKLLNHLTVLQLNFPKAVLERDTQKAATTRYSFRLNQSYAPRTNYLKDLAALPPFLLLAGQNDEAFIAEKFEPLIAAQTRAGQFKVLPDLSHLDIVDDERAAAEIADFISNEQFSLPRHRD